MVEALPDMPAGSIGFRIAGRVDAADYRDVLIPALRTAVEAGELRAVFVVGPDYEGFDLGALKEDLKGAVPLAFEHRSAWKRLAAVTDIEWMGKAVDTFRWLMPGEVQVYPLAELDRAKTWVAGSAGAR
jgi:SpoIIAA-like